MTPFTAFEPGSELECSVCQFRIDAHPGCLIAAELADDGERMSRACCPQADSINCDVMHDVDKFCPCCGSPLPCPTCLAELRCDAA